MMDRLSFRSLRSQCCALLAALALVPAAPACATRSGDEASVVGLEADTALPDRAGAVVIDACTLDPWQRATLAAPGARRVVREVILLCLVPREDGTVGPRDPSAQSALATLAADLKSEGYRVHLGMSFTDETGERYDGAQTAGFLTDAAWRQRARDSVQPLLAPVDGLELDLEQLPNEAQPYVTALVAELAQVVRPAKALDVFVPPSVTFPSDLRGGDAFSRSALAPYVDRMRVMTLDYSEKGPGPTIDPGWAVDAVRFAQNDFHNVDIAYPLYGVDFGPQGHRLTSWTEALGVAKSTGAAVEHGPTGAPFIGYRAFDGSTHQIWFDDATSTGRALGAWSTDVLPADVGVLFWGLGAEEPDLFERLAARMP